MEAISQNKTGYKKTKLGWIPDEWNYTTLDKLCSKISDGLHSTPKYVESSKFHFINGNNLINGRVVISENTKCVSEEEYLQHKRDINEQTILLSINGTIGNIAFYQNELVVLGKSAAYLNVKENLSKEFIYYQLKTHKINSLFNRLVTGSTIKNLGLKAIKETKIPFPPLLEQQKIAAILSTWDKAIEKLEQLIRLKEKRKKGLMQQLLSGKIRFDGFNGNWEKIKLEKVANCHDNMRKPLNSSERNNIKGEIPYCGANGIVDYINDFLIDDDIILIAEDGGYFDEFATRPIAYQMSGKCWVNNHAHILKSKNNCNQNYLYYNLVHLNIMKYLNGGTRAKLNKGELMKIPLFISMNIVEQEKIASILSKADLEIEKLNQQLTVIKLQKKGLMQKLLTGEVRVKI